MEIEYIKNDISSIGSTIRTSDMIGMRVRGSKPKPIEPLGGLAPPIFGPKQSFLIDLYEYYLKNII